MSLINVNSTNITTIREATAVAGQSVIDLALQLYGSLDGLGELCALNELAMTDEIKAGQIFKYDVSKVVGPAVVRLQKVYANLGDTSTEPPVVGGDFNGDFNNDFY